MYCNYCWYSMNNARFATALHILTLLAYADGERLSSEYIAGSLNTNPALVRKEISNLRKHGLLMSKEGKGGGTWLAKPAATILLADIYRAVVMAPLLGRANAPNPACPVGRQINGHLEQLYSYAEEALINQLGQTSLLDFTRRFA